ncbi:MAG: dimethylsulfonioproprionate lyase DddP [Pseudomonadota bacterium]
MANDHSPANMPRKIDPTRRQGVRPDGTPDDPDRVEIGPTQLAFDEWAAAGIDVPNLERMRHHRHRRIVEALDKWDYGAVFLTDPLNIRYATDTTNMQLWNAHNPFRACLVCADGYMVVWDYARNEHLTSYAPLIREVRSNAGLFYFSASDLAHDRAEALGDQIVDLLREHSGGHLRIGVDKMQLHGIRSLEARGITIEDGEEIMEKTRLIKGPDEIAAMRCAIYACEQAMHEMEAEVAPGMTEVDAWAVLQSGNFRRGGEWIETRILSTGPRTNPWMQECGPRVIQPNELFAFDTDMIGCYGMCADLSRTWWIGPGDPSAEQRRLYREAHAIIVENMASLKPGMTFEEVSHAGRELAEEFIPQRYGSKMHGVGLCDEWPSIKWPCDVTPICSDYTLQPGMMLCVETYMGVKGARDGIKLEDQVLITEDGVENLTNYPWDEKLLG